MSVGIEFPGSVLAVACLAVPSRGLFMAAPYYEEPRIDREMLGVWGDNGSYCFMSFSDRVKGPNELPPFLVEQDETCKQNDGGACLERARAHLGGCGGAEENRDRAMELFLRACELGQPDGCTAYVQSTPPKRWGIFSDSKRERAATRAVESVIVLSRHAWRQGRSGRRVRRSRSGGAPGARGRRQGGFGRSVCKPDCV